MSARVNTPDAEGIEAGKKPREPYKPNIHRETTAGAQGQQEQGGTKKKGKGYQITGKVKIWKNIKGHVKRDTPDRSKTRKERKGQIPNLSWERRMQDEQSTSTERKSTDSKTSPMIKEKEDNRRREAQQEDAESQTTRHNSQLQKATGPKRKTPPQAQTEKARRTTPSQIIPSITSTPTGKGARPRNQDHKPPPKGRGQKQCPTTMRPRQESAQNSAHPTGNPREPPSSPAKAHRQGGRPA